MAVVVSRLRLAERPPVEVAQAPVVPSRRPLFVVTSEIRELPRTRWQRQAKRAVDIVGSVLAIALLSPVFVATAIAVRLTSRGPIFFVQDRCGLGGRLFRFYKFRTMVVDAEARKAELAALNEMHGPVFKIERDPRVTPIGRILRKLSIDELPQLWNVIRGEMSLVGPRPLPLRDYELLDDLQKKRYLVLPGLTGLWQVSGRSELSFDELVRLDFYYIETWSIWLDLTILARTIPVVLGRKGAY